MGDLTADRLQVGIGASEHSDGREAGAAAARAACADLNGRRPDLVLVFASVRYDLAAVLAGINSVTGGAPLAGASSSGHLHAGTLTQPGEGLAVLALASTDYRFGVASVTEVGANSFHAGRELARAARTAAGTDRLPHEALLVLSDGLTGDQQELLNGIHRVTGVAVPVVGGAAGDDRRLARTYVMRDGEVFSDAAVAVWIGSPRPLTVVSGHGWQPTGLPLLVTGVDGPVVREISGRPALEVYREHFRFDNPMCEIPSDRDGGYHSAHAFGLIQPDGQLLIRGAFVDDEGQLRTFAPLPAYAAVQVVSCGPDDLLDVGDATLADALDGADASVALVFSCVARLDILAGRSAEEAQRLQKIAGEVPTFGFYTYGEFARTTSVVGYHNATIAAVIL
ncbi:FIST signal transduction protein [Luedemannella helvata]|uniref:FIST N-terminal domain-containing protein n=1 Tax=Luedemannella helvata TaxID=349315 RepID=A0ABP4WR77_9ACTN